MAHHVDKTGCWVFLEDYREWVYGDAHKVGNTLIIRVAQRFMMSEPIPTRLKHYTVRHVDYWPDRNDPNVKFPMLLAELYTNHGYEGVPI